MILKSDNFDLVTPQIVIVRILTLSWADVIIGNIKKFTHCNADVKMCNINFKNY